MSQTVTAASPPRGARHLDDAEGDVAGAARHIQLFQPGCGFSHSTIASFQMRWTPALIRSFIRS